MSFHQIPRVGPNIGYRIRHQGSSRAATAVDRAMEKTLRCRLAWQQAVLFNGNTAGLQIPELTPKHRNASMPQAALQAPCLHLSMGFSKQPHGHFVLNKNAHKRKPRDAGLGK